jgi:hypothetical protein
MEDFRYTDAYAPPSFPPSGGSLPPAAKLQISEQDREAVQTIKSGARWFLWVAILSQINSIFMFLNINRAFCIGLGMMPLTAGVVQAIENPDAVELTAAAKGAGFAVGLLGMLFFLVIYFFAQRGHRTAFIIGMATYFIDGLIFLFFFDLLSLAFHGFAFFNMFRGLRAAFVLKRAEPSWAG